MSHTFSAIIEREGKWYVALCPELDVVSQGDSVEDSLKNLKEAVQLYLGSASPEELKSLPTAKPLITTVEVTV